MQNLASEAHPPDSLSLIQKHIWETASNLAHRMHQGLREKHLVVYTEQEVLDYLHMFLDQAEGRRLIAVDFIGIEKWYAATSERLRHYLERQLEMCKQGRCSLARLRFVRAVERQEPRARQLTSDFVEAHKNAGAELLLVRYEDLPPSPVFYPDTGSFFVDPDGSNALVLYGRLGGDQIITKADIYFGSENEHLRRPLEEFEKLAKAAREKKTTEAILRECRGTE